MKQNTPQSAMPPRSFRKAVQVNHRQALLHHSRLTNVFGALLVALIFAVQPVRAQTTYSLSLSTNQSWNTAPWVPSGTPGSLDTVDITGGGGSPVLRLTSATTEVAVFNYLGGANMFVGPDTSSARTLNINTFNYVDAGATGITFSDFSTSGTGPLTVNIETVNLDTTGPTNFLRFGSGSSVSASPLLKEVSVGSTNITEGRLFMGALRQNTGDPLNANLGAVTMTGGEILLSETAGTFSNIILFESLGGTGGFIRVSPNMPGTPTEGTIRIVGSSSTAFAGDIQDGGNNRRTNFEMAGTGVQTLSSNSNNYTGQTLVASGTLLINGVQVQAAAGKGGGDAADGIYRVASGGTLGGTGRISGNGTAADTNMVLVQSGGILAPGASIGTLTLDGLNISGSGSTVLNMASGAQFSFELAGDGSSADRIRFWNYGGADDFARNDNVINLSLLGAPDPGTYTVVLFDFFSNNGTTPAASGISGGLTLTGASIDPNISSATLLFNTNDISLEYTVIPEPNAAILLMLAAGAWAGRRKIIRKLGA